MDISTFRWTLIIVGIVIVAGIFLLGNPDKKRKPRASRKRSHASRITPEQSVHADQQPDPPEYDHADAVQPDLAIGDTDGQGERIEPTLDDIPRPPPPPDKLVTLFLRARDNHVITGVELLDAALKAGLVFGDHDIFHRIDEDELDPVFSMANLVNPGTFDKTSWNTMEIRGVTMFMALPGPKGALDAWDSMLATSRRLAEVLQADLLDDAQEVFTRNRSMQIKDELRDYERKKDD